MCVVGAKVTRSATVKPLVLAFHHQAFIPFHSLSYLYSASFYSTSLLSFFERWFNMYCVFLFLREKGGNLSVDRLSLGCFDRGGNMSAEYTLTL